MAELNIKQSELLHRIVERAASGSPLTLHELGKDSWDAADVGVLQLPEHRLVAIGFRYSPLLWPTPKGVQGVFDAIRSGKSNPSAWDRLRALQASTGWCRCMNREDGSQFYYLLDTGPGECITLDTLWEVADAIIEIRE